VQLLWEIADPLPVSLIHQHLSVCSGDRFLDRLLCNHEEELEVAELVHALVAMATVIDLHGGAFRQPDAELGLVEVDGSV